VWLDVPSTVKIDTLSYTRFNWKLRNSFTFRWNYAQFAMNQPYSFYSSASFARFWNPFNSFDMYWNRSRFWHDWAFSFPYFNYHYQMPRYYMYEQPHNVAIMRGRRGSIVRPDRIDVIASNIRKEIKIKPPREIRNYTDNNINKITPRENPGQINYNTQSRYETKSISRVDVNRTKVKMKK
tara:strand:- start:123 stop:665 length:543 start_codon:yes stop_codon:yes gene_type:complete